MSIAGSLRQQMLAAAVGLGPPRPLGLGDRGGRGSRLRHSGWMQAGRVVPIRFWLGGRPGPDVLAAGSPGVHPVSCDTWEPVAHPEPALRLGPHWLGHSWRFGLYQLLWKTDRRWAGRCRQLELELDDGSIHRANFLFARPHGAHWNHTSVRRSGREGATRMPSAVT